ncbi:unnamed protein product [Victoria cruziana]
MSLRHRRRRPLRRPAPLLPPTETQRRQQMKTTDETHRPRLTPTRPFPLSSFIFRCLVASRLSPTPFPIYGSIRRSKRSFGGFSSSFSED